MSSSGVDYYNIDELFTDEEKLVRDTIKEFINTEILPVIEHNYQNNRFPLDIVPHMAELGLFGINIDEKYGGVGANSTVYGLAMQELERGDSAIRSFASVQNSLVMYPINKYGSEAQKSMWLPKLADGSSIGCFGLTEPDYGSNPAGMITNAKEVDGGYILNGTKMWITNGSIADIAVVWAKIKDKLYGFIVERGMKGFSSKEMTGKHSLKASITSELVFDDVFVPKENILNVEGLKGPLSCLTQARFGIAWGVVGSAIACYESALNYAKTRIQFNKPIASFQIIQSKLVWMLEEITKAQLINYRLGRLKDEGRARTQQVSLAKRNNVKMALDVARLSREIHGANGILGEYPVMRHAANLESVNTYEGTYDIHTLILGQDITGISAFI